jgi:ribokinase
LSGEPEGFRKEARGLTKGVLTITLGGRGSVTFRGDEIMSVPAFDVQAVDTTGAGDVFHGGYIYGLLRGWDLMETVRFASALAAIKCRAMGGRAGIPGLGEVMESLRERA